MTCWALLALKLPKLGKSRLAGALSREHRVDLIMAMLEHVLEALEEAAEIDRIAVVTPVPEILPRGVEGLLDRGCGLNPALDQGRRELIARGADELLVLHPDLPHLTAAEVDSFVRRGRTTGLALAPDHHGCGTNGVFLSLPSAFDFRFGRASLRQHLAEARSCGLAPVLCAQRGFALDIDEPADLRSYPGPQGGFPEPSISSWSTTPWTAHPRPFSPSHIAEPG